MSIVNTIITIGATERDGRKNVKEDHLDHAGVHHVFEYLSDNAGTIQATADARKAQLEADLPIQELDEIEAQLLSGINPFPTPPHGFTWNTRQEALQAMFTRLMARPVAEVVPVAGFLDHVQDSELAASGFSDQQIADIRARVTQIKGIKATLEQPAFVVG